MLLPKQPPDDYCTYCGETGHTEDNCPKIRDEENAAYAERSKQDGQG
jgi:hypothetical protein